MAGVGPIRGFAKGRDNTFMHCLELILEAMGRNIGYDELMGISGQAFRIQFRVDRWDAGNADPLAGASTLDALFKSIGLVFETHVVRRDELDEAADLQEKIKRSIDRGLPVLAANIIEPEDWGIITGYRPNDQWLCRSYNGDALREDRPANGWPTAVVILTKRLPRPSPQQARVASIRRAVDLFEQRKAGNHALGAKAFDYWCQALPSVENRRYLHPNAWTYIGLIDARAAAVRYLRGVAKEFGSRKHQILQAADYYDAEVRLLREGYRFVPSEKAYPESLPPADLRKKQIEVLRKAKELERKAIGALRDAL